MVTTPESSLIENEFHLDGVVQDHNWTMDITYPATDAPEGANLKNIYKTVCKARSASFVFALPKEYEFNIKEFKYLKMSVYAPEKSTYKGAYSPFQKLWPRFMNSMWSFGSNSSFGQQYWAIDPFEIQDNELQKWTEITLDLSSALDKHNRVIVLNIGGEPGIDPWAPETEIAYYFANLRFSKKP